MAAADNISLVATNELHETCLATPAISDGTLFFRTREKLIAVGTRERRTALIASKLHMKEVCIFVMRPSKTFPPL